MYICMYMCMYYVCIYVYSLYTHHAGHCHCCRSFERRRRDVLAHLCASVFLFIWYMRPRAPMMSAHKPPH